MISNTPLRCIILNKNVLGAKNQVRINVQKIERMVFFVKTLIFTKDKDILSLNLRIRDKVSFMSNTPLICIILNENVLGAKMR